MFELSELKWRIGRRSSGWRGMALYVRRIFNNWNNWNQTVIINLYKLRRESVKRERKRV